MRLENNKFCQFIFFHSCKISTELSIANHPAINKIKDRKYLQKISCFDNNNTNKYNYNITIGV